MSAVETDSDKALTALRLLGDICSTAIDALQQPFSATQASLLDSQPTCAVLNKDFQSLLTLIYTSTTKVTLVLRPSAPAPSAALAPIKDLGTSITSLATCATLFDLHGSTLSSEARFLACNVFEAVRALTNMFVESAGEDYLVRTGAVHDLVEKARRDLPADNLAAVKLRWKADRGMLEDAMEEINHMIEENGQDGEEEPDELDDEWDELGFGSSKKMSDVELERTKKIQPLARFVTLLHKRVVPDVLGGLTVTESIPDTVNSTLDALPPKSHALVLALEEVVATLYAPQKPDALAAAVSSLVEAAHKLHDSISNDPLVLPSTVDVVARALSLDGGKSSGEKKAKDPRTWFESCRAQIDKTAKMIEQMLAGQGFNTT